MPFPHEFLTEELGLQQQELLYTLVIQNFILNQMVEKRLLVHIILKD
jgi:hypothetical protein